MGLEVELGLHGDESVDGLSGEIISSSDDGSLGDSSVNDQRRLDLSGRKSVTRDVDDIIDSSLDPDVSVLVSSSTVSREVESGVGLEVGLDESGVILVDGSGDTRPGLGDDENSLDVVSDELSSGGRVEDLDLNSGEGEGSGSGLGWDRSGKRSDDDGSSLGLPVGVDDGALSSSDVVVVPVPGLGVDGLSDGSDDSQTLEGVILDEVLTKSSKETNGSRSSVEMSDLVLVNGVPVSRSGRVDGSGLEDGGGDSVEKRTVDDVGVTSDPSDVGHAGELVSRVDVEDVLDRESSSEQVTSSGVDDSLGLSSASRGVKDEQGILSAHDLDGADRRDLSGLLVPPSVSTLSPVDLSSSSLENEDVLDERALLESGVDDALGSDALSSSSTLIGGDHDSTLAILGSIPQGLSRESSEDDRVDGSDPSTSEESSSGLPGHGKVDRDAISLLDSPRLEDVGDLRNLPEKLDVGDLDVLSRLISLVEDSNLVRLSVGPSVDTVVGGIESSFREPLDVSLLEATRTDGRERSVPVEGLVGHLPPPIVGSLLSSDGLSVELLVVLKSRSNVRDGVVRVLSIHSRSDGEGRNLNYFFGHGVR